MFTVYGLRPTTMTRCKQIVNRKPRFVYFELEPVKMKTLFSDNCKSVPPFFIIFHFVNKTPGKRKANFTATSKI